MRSPFTTILSALALSATTGALAACSENAPDQTRGAGSGGTAARGGSGGGGSRVNVCGVAAPFPAETGQCTTVSQPVLTDFDDYTGTDASKYTFYVNAAPPAADALLAGFLHVGDGSDASGSVVATDMVTGQGESGYALQISNTNALTWGGLLMLYLPHPGAVPTCLDARTYEGLEFSIKGSSPSGRFGVSVGMLDTLPAGESGLCNNATASDCKDATTELVLPADAAAWTTVRVPWASFTPGVGGDLSCVPVTGQNIVRVVIQPFMSYPPPDFTFQPGAYALAVDDVRFF